MVSLKSVDSASLWWQDVHICLGRQGTDSGAPISAGWPRAWGPTPARSAKAVIHMMKTILSYLLTTMSATFVANAVSA